MPSCWDRIWDSTPEEKQRAFATAANSAAWTAVVRRWEGEPEKSRMTYIGVDPEAPKELQLLARSLLMDVLGIESVEDLDRMAGDVVAAAMEFIA